MEKNNHYDILLIYPPIGTFAAPYPSIPVLSAHLSSKKLRLYALDLNMEFILHLLSQGRIEKGIAHSTRRFLVLNNKPALSFSEKVEYHLILKNLLLMQKNDDKIKSLLSHPGGNVEILRNLALRECIQIPTLPYFPEIVIPAPNISIISPHTPFSTASIIKGAREENYTTEIFEEILVEIIGKVNPKIIGFSVPFYEQVIPTFQSCHILKKIAPEAHITLGGPFISIHMREITNKEIFSFIDSLILDEGEIPLEKLFHQVSAPGETDLSKIPGLVYLHEGEIRRNALPAPIDLEQSPTPNFNIFPLERYPSGRDRIRLSIRFSKGCQWRLCTFCQTSLPVIKNFQQMGYSKICEDLRKVMEETGVKQFFFSDESIDPDLLEVLARKFIKERLDIQWNARGRFHASITKGRCQIFRDSGCTGLALGIESLNDRILRLMRKGISRQLVEDVLYQNNGTIDIGCFMIVGFPTETEEEALTGYETLRGYWREGLIKGFNYNLFNIAYGSDIYKNPKNYGISKINITPGNDLFPGISDFECTGMSREKASGLLQKFHMPANIPSPYDYLERIRLDNEEVALNFDIREIHDAIKKRKKQFYKNFFDFLKQEEKNERH